MGAPVLAPARLCFLLAQRQLLAVTDRGQPVATDSEGYQIALRCRGSFCSESQIVLDGSPVVTVTFDFDASLRVILEPIGIFLQRLARRFVELERIVVERDVVQRPGVGIGAFAVLALLRQRQATTCRAAARGFLAVAGLPLLALESVALLLRRAPEGDEHRHH